MRDFILIGLVYVFFILVLTIHFITVNKHLKLLDDYASVIGTCVKTYTKRIGPDRNGHKRAKIEYTLNDKSLILNTVNNGRLYKEGEKYILYFDNTGKIHTREGLQKYKSSLWLALIIVLLITVVLCLKIFNVIPW